MTVGVLDTPKEVKQTSPPFLHQPGKASQKLEKEMWCYLDNACGVPAALFIIQVYRLKISHRMQF